MENPKIEINKKILFVGHDANRAGAQLLLLRFLTLLKQNADVPFAILLRHGGELLKEFEALAPVYIWYQLAPVPKLFKQVRKMLKFEGSHKPHQAILEQLSVHKFDLIVANTIANGDILPQLKAALKCKVLSYIHEMEMHIRMYTQPAYLKHVFESSDGYIACGQAVKENLIENHQIEADKIQVLPSLLPEEAFEYVVEPQKSQQLRRSLGIEDDVFLVGGMGTVDLRKGVDLFVQLAAQFANQPVYFLWVGGSKTTFEFQLFQLDCHRLEITNIQFVEAVNNPLDYMAAFDLFLLCSREEGYPLVLMEAGLLEKPMIAFEKAGGAKDIIEQDAGILVPYLDLEATKQSIQKIMNDKDFAKTIGENARKKVLERHQKSTAFKKFVEILRQ